MSKNKEPQILAFGSLEEWRDWLSEYHERQEGVWLKFYKKDSGIKTVRKADALDEALCFGWIDGQMKSYDKESWLIRFTPRRKGSIWSKKNRENAERLIRQNRMSPPGLKEIERAKTDGRWDAAYDSPKQMEVPEDFIEALKVDPGSYEFFLTLNKANTYAIAWRLQTAKKPETREKRFARLLDMMKRREKLH